MSETFQCGDPGSLVAYLYDECTSEERETIAAHLTRCVACAGEVSALTSTRQALAVWAPPDVDLGLQITRTAAAALTAPAGEVLAFRRPQDESIERSLPWWKAPLPAWAQAAAALVIFAAGLSVGFARNGAVESNAPQTSASPATTAAAVPSKADLEQLEERLRTEMTSLSRANTSTPTPVPVAARSSDDAIIQRVQQLLAQSEERQRIEFTERTVRQASGFEAQRRADLETVRTTLGQFQGTTGAEVRQQRQAIDEINRYLVRVSQQR
jgi:hypothetical protein